MGAARVALDDGAVVGGQQVGLVPDLQDRPVVHLDAELGQDRADVAGLGVALGAGDVADVQHDVSFLDLLQRGAERLDQFVRQVGDEAHGVGKDRRATVRQLQHPQRRVQGGEQHVLGDHLGLGQPVEQGRFAGVGVAHQSNGRVRMPLAGHALQGPGTAHLVQFQLQLADLVGDQPPVGLDLRLAWAAHHPEAAALALQVGPGPDQARAFVGQPGELHLQASLASPRPAGENLQDQAGAVDDLDLPGLLEVALLDRRQGVVDDGDGGLRQFDDQPDLLDLALAEQGGRRELAQVGDQGLADLQIERQRQADGLFQSRGRGPRRAPALAVWMDDDGALDRRLAVNRSGSFQSFSSSPGSYSCTGCAGMMVEMACL